MNTLKLKQLLNADIKDCSRTFYLHLITMGDTKIGYSNNQLADSIGISKRTVSRALAELQETGLITTQIHYAADGKTVLGRTITLK